MGFPTYKAGDVVNIRVLTTNGYEIHPRQLTIFSFGKIEGRRYLTASDFAVYTHYPLLDLVSGEHTELWRQTRPPKDGKYDERFDGWSVARNNDPPHPRCFEVAERKLFKGSGWKPSELSGYQSPGSTVSLCFDDEGHVWSGDLSRQSARCYAVEKKNNRTLAEPEIRFMTPWLAYLGPDGEIWWKDRWRSSDSDHTRLALCTHEVSTAIQEAGMFGHYFPKGEARSDKVIAAAEMKAYKEAQWDYEPLKADLAETKASLEAAESAQEALSDQVRASNRQAGELKEENDLLRKANADLSAVVEANRLRAKQARSFDPLWGGEEDTG